VRAYKSGITKVRLFVDFAEFRGKFCGIFQSKKIPIAEESSLSSSLIQLDNNNQNAITQQKTFDYAITEPNLPKQ